MAEPLCRVCFGAGRAVAATETDHILSKAKGGTDDMANLQPLCRECHQAKTQREAAEGQGRAYRPRRRIGADGWPVE